MKWLIASDLHGSFTYCQKLMEAYAREQADRMLLLGDVLYHGPRNDLPEGYAPKKVFALLNEKKDEIYCVRGNCEADIDQAVLAFPVLADYALLALGRHMIFATHGHLYNTEKLPPLKSGDILLHGHTHVSVCEKHEGFVYMNPGSISLPKDGVHGYMTLEGDTFLWKTVDGETYRTYRVPTDA